MIQQEESTAVSEMEHMKLKSQQHFAYSHQLQQQGLYPEGTSLRNTDVHGNAQQSHPSVGNTNEVRINDESFPQSFQCKSMQQPQSMDSLDTQASGKSITNSLNRSEQMIFASVDTRYGEQPLQNHPSYSGQFSRRPNPQLEHHPGNQTAMANNQDTSHYHQRYDNAPQAQPISNEAGQGRVVMANYSGVLKQNVPETGNPLSLRNKQLNELHKMNCDVFPQPMSNEEGQGRVVTPNYSGVLKPNVSEAENPLSLRNRQLNDQNTVNYSATSQPNSLDTATQRAQTVDESVMPHRSGEVLPSNKERLWSIENHRLNEQNISLNHSVGAPHSSQMPSDLRNNQDNQFTTPNQYSDQGTTHLSSPPFSDQLKGSVQRHPVGPHGFVPDTTHCQGPVHHSAEILTVRQGNSYISMQARDNRGDPNHPARQGNQFIDRSRQQQPEYYDNPPGHLDTARRQGNQPMGTNYNHSQISDGRQGNKKVFILHYDDVPEFYGKNPVLQLAVALRQLEVDVALDLFELDIGPNNWSFWYEEGIRSSDVVLCMITENFYYNLTTGDRVKGYSLYNLMNSSNIAVRAVFLNAPKNLDLAPPAIRGATSYRIDTNHLDVHSNEEFASLYAFLTGQNRIEKPPLGNMVKLAPKRSRFGSNQGGQHRAAPAGGFNRGPLPGSGGYNMGQPPHGGFNRGPPPPMAAYQPAGFNQGPPLQKQFQPSCYGIPPGPAASQPDVDQANLLYSLLAGDTTAISTVRSHNRMFQTLATKMAAEWEPLGRALGLRDPEVYAICRDHGHSVVEQAVQMFRTWLEKNGSRATFGALTMAVYDTGMQYWNLLEILNKHTLKQ